MKHTSYFAQRSQPLFAAKLKVGMKYQIKMSHCKTNGKNNINFVQSAPRILQSINYPQEGKKKNQQHFNEVKVELVYQSPSHYKTKQCNKYVCSSFLLYISTSHVKFSVCKWLLPS